MAILTLPVAVWLTLKTMIKILFRLPIGWHECGENVIATGQRYMLYNVQNNEFIERNVRQSSYFSKWTC